MVLIPVLCPHCQSDQVIRGGKTKTGQQRYKWVVYFRIADKYLGPLASGLSGVNQPVPRSQIRFSASR